MPALSPRQLHRLVNIYIGVSGGYLGDFSYRSHAEFYMNLDIDVDPNSMSGTTRERFIAIVNGSTADIQARIIRGVLEKYPVGSTPDRTQELGDELAALANNLDGVAGPRRAAPRVESPSLVVRRALQDAERLLGDPNGASSAVDRVHTALHGYLRTICEKVSIEIVGEASASRVLTLIVQSHPRFADMGARADETKKTLRTLGAVVDALGTQRNLATLVHPNDELLDEPESKLAVDAAYAIISYLESRIRRAP